MTQCDRVLAALAMRGTTGITAVDFAAPDVIDGGTPIMRVAARVKDLRDSGLRIENRGRRNQCDIYVLVNDHREVESCSTVGACDPEGGQLFQVPAQPASSSHWREDTA